MPVAVSVVIPVYARQATGERAIRSALAGGVEDLEIVVVDDASPDPFALPPDLRGDGRIRLIRHPANRGESGARNTGMAAARGRWIAFLDSDDYWLPRKLADQLAFAEADQARRPDPLTVYGTGFVYRYLRRARSEGRIPAESADPADFASGIWFAAGSTALFQRRAFAIVGPCDESLRRLQDLDWFLRLALAGGALRVLDRLLAVVEVGAKPSLGAVDAAARAMEAKWLAAGDAVLPGRLRRRLRAYLDLERASAAWHEGDRLAFGRFLARSLLAVPRARIPLRRFWRFETVPPGVAG